MTAKIIKIVIEFLCVNWFRIGNYPVLNFVPEFFVHVMTRMYPVESIRLVYVHIRFMPLGQGSLVQIFTHNLQHSCLIVRGT